MVVHRHKAIRASVSNKLQFRSPSNSQVVDHHLLQILESIAHLLLRHGYGFSRVNKLTKVAFVNAARAIDARSLSRISIARIAAVTGLTRTEVSQLLRSADYRASSISEPLNRAARVASGWVSDQKFCDELGHPRRLAFTSTRNSFTTLVKKYSGDIPARAMLAEMKRLGMVRHDSDDGVRLGKTKRSGSRLTISAMRAIAPWVHFFSDIDKFGQMAELKSDAQRLRLQFESIPQALAATRDIENRRAKFVEALKNLGSCTDGRAKHYLDVSIVMAIAAANYVAPTQRRQRHERAIHERKTQQQ